MTKIRVYYEEHQGLDGVCLVPMKLIVRFPRGKMLWDKPAVYIPLDVPFRRHYSEDFLEDLMSIAIGIDDMMMSFDKPKHIGISLTRVMERMEKMKERDMLVFQYEDIEQFIIQIDDIEQVLQMQVRPFYVLS
ncbi:hypothetical protein GCM10023310_50540 [Paenibacillus vulneris]|uniref:Uncharacterized protein n=1 Tax=Paenibacillus vulneris TaxID=1133364 RepID=A0ABW3UKS8_9BACL|nr:MULTISPECIES: hypothetical protein [unclassified Paenibacillus]MBE1444201.1 hypothetical protein [Paenibacillus sp. OAS669]